MTIHAQLHRVYNNAAGVMGVLCFDGNPFFMTLERPWRLNEPNVSCIPSGFYVCERVESPKFGETFEVKNVPGRTHILFHAGNWIKDSLGCILIGRGFKPDPTGLDRMVTDSAAAMEDFRKHLSHAQCFTLAVTWPGVPCDEVPIL